MKTSSIALNDFSNSDIVIVILEARFYKKNGYYYGSGGHNYYFWQDYLSVFKKVIVAARVIETSSLPPGVRKASGPDVQFFDLPGYIGPFEFAASCIRLFGKIWVISRSKYCYMLRVPGILGCIFSFFLSVRNYPFGVELLGDAEESLSYIPGIIPALLKPVLYLFTKQQCDKASVTAYCSRVLETKYPGSEFSNRYYYTGIRIDKSLISSHRDFPPHNKKCKLIYVASMFIYKGHKDLIEAMSILSADKDIDYELILIGDGPEMGRLKQIAEELDLSAQIDFKGRLPSGREVYHELDRADIYVSPSLTEGKPKAVIEAMARGLPVILSDIPGHADFEYLGNLFNRKNPDELAKLIAKVSCDHNLLNNMSIKSSILAREYTQELVSRKRFECYKYLRDKTSKYFDKYI